MNFLKGLASSLLDEQEKFTDLTQVAVVDANACLDVLSKRFEHQSIYTNCGPLLVAVNPYTEIEGLYSSEQLEKFLTIMPAETPEPHVFGMAARAYQKMMATGDNQAVVISGESGAGKTETAKLLLQYLAAAASGTSAGSTDERGALQNAVMATNPVMESFGCAKTVRNDNSSRFGKLVLLKFTKTGRLEAASMQTYLLEKSRVAFQSANECNFHAFFGGTAAHTSRAPSTLPPPPRAVAYRCAPRAAPMRARHAHDTRAHART
jgi:myosin heavy subunit